MVLSRVTVLVVAQITKSVLKNYFKWGSTEVSNYETVKSIGYSKRYLTGVKYGKNWGFMTANGRQEDKIAAGIGFHVLVT